MKKVFLLSAFMALPFLASAQTLELQAVEQQVVGEQQYYMYNIVTFLGSLRNEGFRVNLDNGKEIEKLKDKDGNKMKFKTPAAALMYLVSEGWELYVNGSTTSGSVSDGSGSSTTTTYWIIRKPCTKAEFEQAVQDGIK